MVTSLLTVPTFIEAKSKPELVKRMLIVQQRLKMKVQFFDIQYADGKWVAWYEVDFKNDFMKPKDGK